MRIASLLLAVSLLVPAAVPASFVNWETPHVSPLAMTPDGNKILAVNTPDNRLEVFDLSSGSVVPSMSIPVGLDPVSVRARSNGEAWVVNHVSDSISIVDLATGNVIATLRTNDEPADVVFAGNPERAFVSCSQPDEVMVFDPADLAAAPTVLDIIGEDPRALAVSADGSEVYVAIFESGNRTTILGGNTSGFEDVVDDPTGPYGGVNPPGNMPDGSFEPPMNALNPDPPGVGLIVKQGADGIWRDDRGTDWTEFVSGAKAEESQRFPGWQLIDHDLAVIDTTDLSISYLGDIRNANMAIAVRPGSGEVTMVGTDGINEVRFEPNLKGRFLIVNFSSSDPAAGTSSIVDLNLHLDYSVPTLPQAERDKSLGDPRGIAWNGDGSRGYVSGMGSNNVVVIDGSGGRSGLAETIEVGEGPTGLVVDEARGQLYVLNKFDASLSTVDLGTETETARLAFFDPSPEAIQTGRKHLYDTHATSGLGQTSCASCHLDARLDRLGWDLGDPAGEMKGNADQNLGEHNLILSFGFEDFHPMKGPMQTQTLQDIIGKEPLHWRGDRDGIEEFNPAFTGLLGDDVELTPTEMQEFEDFLATLTFPPNPFRNFDNTLPTALDMPDLVTTDRFGDPGRPLPVGDAVRGLELYLMPNVLDGRSGIGLACSTCHTLPTGMGPDTRLTFPSLDLEPIPPGPNGERHLGLVSVDGSENVTMKTSHLRNLYQRVGFDYRKDSTSGFGTLHDGSAGSVTEFVGSVVFDMLSDQDIADMTAFMLAFAGSDLPAGRGGAMEPHGPPSLDTHAAVGWQLTVSSAATVSPDDRASLISAAQMAQAGAVGLVAKGRFQDEPRGYTYVTQGAFQSDKAGERLQITELLGRAAPGSELTFTVVPRGSEVRIGIDRDEDGVFDGDE